MINYDNFELKWTTFDFLSGHDNSSSLPSERFLTTCNFISCSGEVYQKAVNLIFSG